MLECVEQAKKASETTQIDKDYTQIAIQSSLKELVDNN